MLMLLHLIHLMFMHLNFFFRILLIILYINNLYFLKNTIFNIIYITLLAISNSPAISASIPNDLKSYSVTPKHAIFNAF